MTRIFTDSDLKSGTQETTKFFLFPGKTGSWLPDSFQNLRESGNGAEGISDIEGKVATGSGERVGK
jgi:hypothetical protein